MLLFKEIAMFTLVIIVALGEPVSVPIQETPPTPPPPGPAHPAPAPPTPTTSHQPAFELNAQRFSTTDLYAIEAFDCSTPANIHHVQVHKREPPCDRPVKATSAEPASFSVLQEALRTPLTGYRCVLTETRIPIYCGNYDHQTMALPLTSFNRQKQVDVEECRRLWQDQKVTIARTDQTFDLPHNKETTFYYEPYGKTYLKAHVECTGETLRANGVKLRHMVVGVHRSYALFEVAMKTTEEGVITDVSHEVQLPCGKNKNGCITDEGTYFWDSPNDDQQCPVYRTRLSKGLLVTNDRGHRVFMSNDGTMIRLSISGEVMKCGHMVHATDYPRVFLAPPEPDALFQRPLPPSEMSILTYVNIQDQFLNADILDTLQDDLTAKETAACLKKKSDESIDYAQIVAEQRSPHGGESAHIGDGWMVTPAGESWIQFQCRPIMTSARIAPACYTSLPVHVSEADDKIFRAARDSTDTAAPLQYFVDPHTRQLTTKAVRTACQSDMAPLYKSANPATWIKVDPMLTLVPAPQLMRPYANAATDFARTEKDFSFGGLYSPEAVEKMELFLHTHRVAKVLTADMAASALANDWDGTSDTTSAWMTPSTIGLKVPATLFDPFSWLAPFLEGYENFCSAIVMVIITFRIGCWASGVLMRAYAGPPAGLRYPGFLIVIFFPSFGDVLLARIAPRQMRHHQPEDRRRARSHSTEDSAHKRALRRIRLFNRTLRPQVAPRSPDPEMPSVAKDNVYERPSPAYLDMAVINSSAAPTPPPSFHEVQQTPAENLRVAHQLVLDAAAKHKKTPVDHPYTPAQIALDTASTEELVALQNRAAASLRPGPPAAPPAALARSSSLRREDKP